MSARETLEYIFKNVLVACANGIVAQPKHRRILRAWLWKTSCQHVWSWFANGIIQRALDKDDSRNTHTKSKNTTVQLPQAVPHWMHLVQLVALPDLFGAVDSESIERNDQQWEGARYTPSHPNGNSLFFGVGILYGPVVEGELLVERLKLVHGGEDEDEETDQEVVDDVAKGVVRIAAPTTVEPQKGQERERESHSRYHHPILDSSPK